MRMDGTPTADAADAQAPPAARSDAVHITACVAVSLLMGLTQGLGVNLINANLSAIQGSLGATAVEASWLVTAYTATNVSAALLLTKARFQFGLRLFADIGIFAFLLVSIVHLFAEQLGSAVLVRAALGLAAAPLSSLALLYMMEAFPARLKPLGLVLGFGTLQLGAPLARVISTDLLQIALWRGLHMVDVGLSLLCVAALAAVRLAPVPTLKMFSRGDVLSFTLFAVSLALFCVVLSEGRLLWWTDAPWLGACLAIGIACLGAYVLIELNRRQPMLDLHWLTSPFMLRFMLAILLFRIVLTEQTIGAVGLMTALGLLNDQMHVLFLWAVFGTALGFLLALVPLAFRKLDWPAYIALVLIIGAAWKDAGVTQQTRPAELILTQTVLALASSMFLASAVAIGFAHVVAGGMKNFISLVAVMTGGQTLAGVIGTAGLGSFIVVRQKLHFAHLAETLNLADPQVASRIAQLSAPYTGTLIDAKLRATQGVAGLAQQVTQQATVQAYSDLFELIAIIAALTLAWLTALKLYRGVTGRPLVPEPPASAPATAAAPVARAD